MARSPKNVFFVGRRRLSSNESGDSYDVGRKTAANPKIQSTSFLYFFVGVKKILPVELDVVRSVPQMGSRLDALNNAAGFDVDQIPN